MHHGAQLGSIDGIKDLACAGKIQRHRRLTDAEAATIVDDVITPRFAEDDYLLGVLAGLDEVRRELGHTVAADARLVSLAEASEEVEEPQDGTPPQDPEELLGGQYGRLRTVVVDAEGALWITTSNKDGVGTPVEDDDKVLRILPPSTAGNSPL